MAGLFGIGMTRTTGTGSFGANRPLVIHSSNRLGVSLEGGQQDYVEPCNGTNPLSRVHWVAVNWTRGSLTKPGPRSVRAHSSPIFTHVFWAPSNSSIVRKHATRPRSLLELISLRCDASRALTTPPDFPGLQHVPTSPPALKTRLPWSLHLPITSLILPKVSRHSGHQVPPYPLPPGVSITALLLLDRSFPRLLRPLFELVFEPLFIGSRPSPSSLLSL